MLSRDKPLTGGTKSVAEMTSALPSAADQLRQMARDGLFIEDFGTVGDDYAFFVTDDPAIAKKYGMVEEFEFLGDREMDEPPETDEESSPQS